MGDPWVGEECGRRQEEECMGLGQAVSLIRSGGGES